MIGLAIAVIVTSPITFLAVGFYGVSKKHAQESREALASPQLWTAAPRDQWIASRSQHRNSAHSPEWMHKRLG
ncbi:MAG: hypothetical protein HLUCCA11_16455 [Phormidesmis priestleyi Ana]|uniref:Uncharacterized protein n=1 Tax=Phormidesmis priestleyi Ana TaxID=1666911 RepID=A0A0P8BK02_9CYAN|nr:MAG: hypothetical protein HLUCCA11_16455 [Phormidesmis priestleyi Ana]